MLCNQKEKNTQSLHLHISKTLLRVEHIHLRKDKERSEVLMAENPPNGSHLNSKVQYLLNAGQTLTIDLHL